jgi:hypothetical protein
MAIQNSVAVRNARLDSFETAVGTAPVLKIFDGTKPANCAAADAGTEVFSGSLPSDWLAAASGGTKALAGTWSGTATGTGTADYYRIYATGGTVCHEQGNVAASGADMNVSNVNFATGQPFSVTAYTRTAGNA